MKAAEFLNTELQKQYEDWGYVQIKGLLNQEEINELKLAIAVGSQAKTEEEFGDVIFSLINYARFLQVDAENALEKTNKKFIHRFTQMEQQALQSGKDLNDMTLQEMDAIWNHIKKQQQE